MVAISLYRGELHRVASVPRRWQIPPRAITLRQFKLLRDKRSLALARIFPDPIPSAPPDAAGDPAAPSGSNPSRENGHGPTPTDGNGEELGLSGDKEPRVKVEPGGRGLTSSGGGTIVKQEKADEEEGKTGAAPDSEERPSSPQPQKVNGTDSEVDVKSEEHCVVEDEVKNELEKKLDILSEKKHHLVQMLRLVLNAEEEMKRRINMQPSAVRDTASIAKHNTTKLSIDVNCGEQGETDFVDPSAPARQARMDGRGERES